MSAVFHINPETGRAGKCSAGQGNCPFGGSESHFTSAEGARQAFEKTMAGQEFNKVSDSEKRVQTRINSGDLQNGDPVFVTSPDGRHQRMGTVNENHNGYMRILFSGGQNPETPINLTKEGWKITARGSDTPTPDEAHEAVQALLKKARRLRSTDSISKNNIAYGKAQQVLAEANARDETARRAELEDVDDDVLYRMDKNARASSYEASMSDYSMGSISRARREVEDIAFEISRRRKELISDGDNFYEDGTRPSEYGDKSGYGVAIDSGGRYDSEIKGYRFPKSGVAIRETYVNGRGTTFSLENGINYPTMESALLNSGIAPVTKKVYQNG